MSGKQCQRGVQEEVRGGNITEEWEEAILRLDGSAFLGGRRVVQAREAMRQSRKWELMSCLEIRKVITQLERKIGATVCTAHPENCFLDLVG